MDAPNLLAAFKYSSTGTLRKAFTAPVNIPDGSKTKMAFHLLPITLKSGMSLSCTVGNVSKMLFCGSLPMTDERIMKQVEAHTGQTSPVWRESQLRQRLASSSGMYTI